MNTHRSRSRMRTNTGLLMCCVSGTAVDPPCTTTPTWVMHGIHQLVLYISQRASNASELNCFTSLRHSSYVRFDILQRILSRLFGITVIHAMVITDIDDKIIRRSWEVSSNLITALHTVSIHFIQIMCLCRKMSPPASYPACTRRSSRGTCCH